MSFRRILTSPRFRERSIVLFFLPFLFLSRFYGHVVLLFSFFPALSPLFFFFPFSFPSFRFKRIYILIERRGDSNLTFNS